MAAAAMKKNIRSSSRTYLCTEIILEILSRLPAKTLFRFKCASRSWFSLIDADEYHIRLKALPSKLLGFYFVLDQLYHVNNTEFYHVDDDDNDNHNNNNIDSRLINTSLSFLPYYMPVVDSCNGLLMCQTDIPRHGMVYCVCNPATKRWVALPTIPYMIHLPLLGFDPTVSPDHYKVVVWAASSPHATDIYIFSSENRECGWAKETTLQTASFFALGNLPHFWVFRDDTFYIPMGSRFIKHSLRRRTVHMFSFPSGPTNVEGYPGRCEYHIGILGGAICCGRIIDSQLKIWTLIEKTDDNDNDGSGTLWVLKHNTVFEIERPLLFVTFHPMSEVVFVGTDHGVWSYNLKTNTLAANFNRRGRRTPAEREMNIAFPYTPCCTDVLKGNTHEFSHAHSRGASSSKSSYLQQLGYNSQQQTHETFYSQLHGPYPQQGLYPRQSRSYPPQYGNYTQQHPPLQAQIQYAQQRHHHQQQENHMRHGFYEQLQQHGQYLHYLPRQHGQYLHQGLYHPQHGHQLQHGHYPQHGLNRRHQ